MLNVRVKAGAVILAAFLTSAARTGASGAATTPAAPATRGAGDADVKTSEPVEVNGVRFQITIPARWTISADPKRDAQVPVVVKATNVGEEEIQIMLAGGVAFGVTDPRGAPLSIMHNTRVNGELHKEVQLKLKKGESGSQEFVLYVKPVDDMGNYQFEHKSGIYRFSFGVDVRKGEEEDRSKWIGKATARDLTFDLVVSPSAETKPAGER